MESKCFLLRRLLNRALDRNQEIIRFSFTPSLSLFSASASHALFTCDEGGSGTTRFRGDIFFYICSTPYSNNVFIVVILIMFSIMSLMLLFNVVVDDDDDDDDEGIEQVNEAETVLVRLR